MNSVPFLAVRNKDNNNISVVQEKSENKLRPSIQ